MFVKGLCPWEMVTHQAAGAVLPTQVTDGFECGNLDVWVRV